MKRLLAVALFGAVLLSCDDKEAKTAAPTAPSALVQQVSAAEALANVPVRARGSSVCSAYLRERTKLQLSLSKTPGDSTLQKKARSLTAMLADACN